MLNVFLTNLGKYNEGELVGEWVDLPCDDFEEVFERIGISDEPDEHGRYYEEWFITDYETDVDGVVVGEYDDLDELNDVAEALEGADAEIIGALMGEGYDIYEAIDKADDVMVFEGCDTMADVAERWYEETGQLAEWEKAGLPTWAVDWEALGRNFETGGHFVEYSRGYIEITD